MARARHKSVPKELKHLVARYERIAEVTKVVLGEIENCKHRYIPGTAKVLGETDAGLRMKAYFSGGVMKIFLVCEDRDGVRSHVRLRGS